MAKMTNAELAARVAELEAELEELRQRLGEADLSEEAIGICRAELGKIGHRGTFFDDVVRAVVQEVKALRYDRQRYEQMTHSTWKYSRDEKTERPMRSPSDPKAFKAFVAWE